jgi:hypothetical protein
LDKILQQFHIIVALLLLSLLTGCQSVQGPVDRDDPNHTPPVGSVIELTRPISVYPDYSRSFIQYGKAVSAQQLNRRYPWCQFRLYEPPAALQSERTIQPDKFAVTQSYTSYASAAVLSNPIAASVVIPGMLGNDGPPDLDFSTIMKIVSAQQPQVVEFKCSIFSEPQVHEFLSINEMQQALGDVVKIHLPQ